MAPFGVSFLLIVADGHSHLHRVQLIIGSGWRQLENPDLVKNPQELSGCPWLTGGGGAPRQQLEIFEGPAIARYQGQPGSACLGPSPRGA